MVSEIRPGEVVIDDTNAGWHMPLSTGGKMRGGLIPRDYQSHPVGCYSWAKPADMPLIPRSEWSERIKAMEADKSRLSDIRMTRGPGGGMIPSRDQNGKGYCVTADTEVLTERGWVAYPDYDWTAPIATVNPLTHLLEFQRPFQRHVYEYDGPIVCSTNRRIDFAVTPDHQMYVRKWDEARRTLSDRYSFVRAGDLGWYAGLLHAPAGFIGTDLVEVEVPGDRCYDGDDFMAMLGLVVSDGYAGGTENTRNWVSFASFREETRLAIEALAARVGFHESPSRRGVWVRYNAGALAAWLRANAYDGGTGAKAKRVPAIVKCASVRQIKAFLHWFDDRTRNGLQYYSTSRGLIDDLQELLLRVGKRSAIGTSPAKESAFAGNADGVIHGSGGYVLTVGDVDRLCLDRNKHIETDHYKGLVYCAAVPNHTLITRRNGSVLISSNCWAHSGVSAHLMVRAVMNEPYADLSAYAIACIIKAYRDEGGWGAQGVDWQIENGCPTAQFWAQQSMSRSNDTPEMRANAKLHRIIDQWADLSAGQYDRDLTFDQLGTLLLSRVPCIVDYYWWSHSVCAIDLVETSPGQFGVRILNSWGDSWSDRGMGILSGSKAIPDGAVAPRLVTPS